MNGKQIVQLIGGPLDGERVEVDPEAGAMMIPVPNSAEGTAGRGGTWANYARESPGRFRHVGSEPSVLT